MRLLELRTPGAAVELHPRLAVVHATEPSRRALVDSLTAALRGGHGAAGFVEVHGIILDLDRDTLRLLDLDDTVEMVLDATDVPVEAVGLAGRQRRTADDAAVKQRELVDARRHQVDAAAEVVAAVQVALRAATEEREAVAARLGETEETLEDTVASREAAERALESATEAVEEVERGAADDITDDEATEDDLTDEELPEPDLQEAIDELDEFDEYDAARHAAEEERAQAALDAVDRAEAAVAEARDEVERAARASNPARLDAADRAELEAAHEAVNDADDRAERRFGGATARRKLDEAKAVERAVLDRVGLDSYSDFLLRSSMGSTDPSAELRLEIARSDLLRAETALSEARTLAAATPAPPPRPAPVRKPAPQSAAKVFPQPKPSGPARPAVESTAAARRREQADEAVARRIAATRARDDALAAESEARASFERAASDLVDAEAKLVELAVRHDDAEQRLAQARVRADADPDAATDATDVTAEPDGGLTSLANGAGKGAALDELDRHLLAWLAARGQHPLADPLPIVLDDVYRHVSAGDLDPLLVRLDHLADSLHVVYLTDDSQVLRWAAGLPPDRCGLSVVPGAGPGAGTATSE